MFDEKLWLVFFAQSMFGSSFDAHVQSPVEFDHWIYYGVGKDLLKFWYGNLSVEDQTKFSARFDALNWPRDSPKFTFNFTTTIGSNYSMAHYKYMRD